MSWVGVYIGYGRSSTGLIGFGGDSLRYGMNINEKIIIFFLNKIINDIYSTHLQVIIKVSE